jgi:hypothetical protein
MTPEQTKEDLRARGWSLAKIARAARPPVTRQAVWKAIHNPGSSKRIDALVARKLESAA